VNGRDVLVEAARLSAAAKPFALATVVRVVRPASTKRGDRGLVTPDGVLTGWVGGACSEPIVVREALRALASGEPRLVSIGPPGRGELPDDVVAAESPCQSEGTVEVLIEPELPQPLLAVVGDAPAATTLVELARAIGWRVSEETGDDADAIVVATMGHGDEDALAAALASGTGYVGLVASSKRASSVLAALREQGFGEEEVSRVRSPAGLDLGPCSQQEIAVAVLAELVAWRRTRPLAPEEIAEAMDPVCGMTVAIEGAREAAMYDDVSYYFCGPGCRRRFEADPSSFVHAASS
jgi:xanthine dehydrogenase accessory factor